MLIRDRNIILALRVSVLPKSLNNVKPKVFERHMLKGAKRLKPHLNALRTMMALSDTADTHFAGTDAEARAVAAIRGWLKK